MMIAIEKEILDDALEKAILGGDELSRIHATLPTERPTAVKDIVEIEYRKAQKPILIQRGIE